MRIDRLVSCLLGFLCSATAGAEDKAYRTPDVPLPTPERPVAIEQETNVGLYTTVFFYPKSCSGGSVPPMTAYYSGRDYRQSDKRNGVYIPAQMGDITYCDGRPTTFFFAGMTYDEFRADVAAGRIVDNQGNRPSIVNLPPISYTVRVPETAWAGGDYWSGPPKPTPPPVRKPAQIAAAKAQALGSQLAASLAQSFARSPSMQIGFRFGAATMDENSVTLDASVMKKTYQFDVLNPKCVLLEGGQQRCSYIVRLTVDWAFMGADMPQIQSGWVSRSDTFAMSGGQFRSPVVDAWLARLADADTGGSSSPSYNANGQYQQQRQQDCRRQVYSALMSGDRGLAAATGFAGCQ